MATMMECCGTGGGDDNVSTDGASDCGPVPAPAADAATAADTVADAGSHGAASGIIDCNDDGVLLLMLLKELLWPLALLLLHLLTMLLVVALIVAQAVVTMMELCHRHRCCRCRYRY